MSPIIICLCSLAVIILWAMNTALNLVRAAITAGFDILVKAIVALFGLAALLGILRLILQLSVDPTVILQFIISLFRGALDLVGALIVAAIVLGIFIALIAFFGGWILNILLNIAIYVLSIILTAFDWAEDVTNRGYHKMLSVIVGRVSDEGGQKQ